MKPPLPILENPERKSWTELLARPVFPSGDLDERVRNILSEVKKSGDRALDLYAVQFGEVRPENRMVQPAEFNEADHQLDEQLKTALRQAKENIERFHIAQKFPENIIETQPGVKCWRKSLPIEKVGLYIPGGLAPLFSTLLMLGVPATLAGCEEIVVCTPPRRDGSIHPAILYAAKLTGIKKIFGVGGVQAIGAMAYGTETIPAVYKIFGPGNQYVTHAKQIIQEEGIAIDMPAGPSELAVFADNTSNPAFVAADLLSQCEHGPDSQVILITGSRSLADRVNEQISEQIKTLPRRAIAEKALLNSKIFLIQDLLSGMDLINQYAPEHLILACEQAEILASKVKNAGSVFIGNFTPESAGDYASGTNHTLPTNGFAKAYSGVGVDSFMKQISFQQLTREGLNNIGKTIIEMAEAEGLDAHAQAVRIRLSGNDPGSS